MKIRMTSIPNGGVATVSVITEAEACAIRNNAFCQPGRVVVRGIENGYSIETEGGQTLLVVEKDG
jgi:hypothetical protein